MTVQYRHARSTVTVKYRQDDIDKFIDKIPKRQVREIDDKKHPPPQAPATKRLLFSQSQPSLCLRSSYQKSVKC